MNPATLSFTLLAVASAGAAAWSVYARTLWAAALAAAVLVTAAAAALTLTAAAEPEQPATPTVVLEV